MITITLDKIQGDYGFEAKDADGKTLTMDTNPDSGGAGFGVRPMQALLMALAGCSGIDLVSILKKQRQQIDGMHIQVDGERETGVEPALWKAIHMKVELSGEIDPAKAQKAAQLSMDKYCSVAETLRRAGAAITWEITVK